MSRAKWNGSVVRRARRYWVAKIVEAESLGTPLVCPFWTIDPQCSGTIRARDSWDVDHAQQLVDDGALGVSNQSPAHTSCNRRAGQRTATARKAEQHTRVRRWV